MRVEKAQDEGQGVCIDRWFLIGGLGKLMYGRLTSGFWRFIVFIGF